MAEPPEPIVRPWIWLNDQLDGSGWSWLPVHPVDSPPTNEKCASPAWLTAEQVAREPYTPALWTFPRSRRPVATPRKYGSTASSIWAVLASRSTAKYSVVCFGIPRCFAASWARCASTIPCAKVNQDASSPPSSKIGHSPSPASPITRSSSAVSALSRAPEACEFVR